MNATPILLHPETLHLRERQAPRMVPAEYRQQRSAAQGRREVLIQHGDRVYRLRHTSNDKLILTK